MCDTAFPRGCACFAAAVSTGVCCIYVAGYGLYLPGGYWIVFLKKLCSDVRGGLYLVPMACVSKRENGNILPGGVILWKRKT